MVLEKIIRLDWISQKPRFAFLLGLVYSLVGLISARIIFSKSTGMMAIAFTSILLIPTLSALLQQEENAEIRKKKFSIKHLLKDHKDVFVVYFFIFLGVFVSFAFVSLVLPAQLAQNILEPELAVAGLAGSAFNVQAFETILTNNLLVLIVCLALSLAYGAGSILFITWNAAVWGSIFGFVARQSAVATGQNPFVYFGITILPALPHIITEAASYFTAAIGGGIISKAVSREKLFSKKFYHVLTDAFLIVLLGFVLVVIAAVVESRLL
jgi:uncharacterized membrane protein SpoIIM required for sporulation